MKELSVAVAAKFEKMTDQYTLPSQKNSPGTCNLYYPGKLKPRYLNKGKLNWVNLVCLGCVTTANAVL